MLLCLRQRRALLVREIERFGAKNKRPHVLFHCENNYLKHFEK